MNLSSEFLELFGKDVIGCVIALLGVMEEVDETNDPLLAWNIYQTTVRKVR